MRMRTTEVVEEEEAAPLPPPPPPHIRVVAQTPLRLWPAAMLLLLLLKLQEQQLVLMIPVRQLRIRCPSFRYVSQSTTDRP